MAAPSKLFFNIHNSEKYANAINTETPPPPLRKENVNFESYWLLTIDVSPTKFSVHDFSTHRFEMQNS